MIYLILLYGMKTYENHRMSELLYIYYCSPYESLNSALTQDVWLTRLTHVIIYYI